MAGLGSTTSAALTAWTRSSCAPTVRSVTSCGDSHSANAAASSEHSNVTPGWSEEKLNSASVLVVEASGPVTMFVSGGIGATTVHSWRSGVASTLPAASRARTRNVWSPRASAVTVWGEVQPVNETPSSEHSNVAPASSAEKVNVAVVASVGEAGPVSIDVSGATASIAVHVRVAGVASTLRAASIACTANVCSPSARSWISTGDEHDSNGPPSSEHSKSRSAASVVSSVPPNSITTSTDAMIPEGPAVMTVSGAVMSATTDHA